MYYGVKQHISLSTVRLCAKFHACIIKGTSPKVDVLYMCPSPPQKKKRKKNQQQQQQKTNNNNNNNKNNLGLQQNKIKTSNSDHSIFKLCSHITIRSFFSSNTQKLAASSLHVTLWHNKLLRVLVRSITMIVSIVLNYQILDSWEQKPIFISVVNRTLRDFDPLKHNEKKHVMLHRNMPNLVVNSKRNSFFGP